MCCITSIQHVVLVHYHLSIYTRLHIQLYLLPLPPGDLPSDPSPVHTMMWFPLKWSWFSIPDISKLKTMIIWFPCPHRRSASSSTQHVLVHSAIAVWVYTYVYISTILWSSLWTEWLQWSWFSIQPVNPVISKFETHDHFSCSQWSKPHLVKYTAYSRARPLLFGYILHGVHTYYIDIR